MNAIWLMSIFVGGGYLFLYSTFTIQVVWCFSFYFSLYFKPFCSRNWTKSKSKSYWTSVYPLSIINLPLGCKNSHPCNSCWVRFVYFWTCRISCPISRQSYMPKGPLKKKKKHLRLCQPIAPQPHRGNQPVHQCPEAPLHWNILNIYFVSPMS